MLSRNVITQKKSVIDSVKFHNVEKVREEFGVVVERKVLSIHRLYIALRNLLTEPSESFYCALRLFTEKD